MPSWAGRERRVEVRPTTSVTPLVTGSVAVVADGGAVTGLRLADGRPRWRWTSGQWVDGAWSWRGLVAVLTGGNTARPKLTGLDAATGAVAWTRRLPGYIYGAPVVTVDGGLAMAGGIPPGASGPGVLEVVSLASGKVRWARRTGLFEPLAVAGRLVLATPDGRRLAGYDASTGAIRWTFGSLADSWFVTPLTGPAVVTWADPPSAGTTLLAAIDAATGRVRWQLDPQPRGGDDMGPLVTLPARGWPAVLAADYLPGRLWLVSGRNGRVRWSVPAPLVPGTAPLAAGPGVVAFETPGAASSPVTPTMSLVGRDAGTGVVRWARRLPVPVSAPAVRAGPDIVLNPDRSLTDGEPSDVLLAFRADTGRPAWGVTLPAPAAAPQVPAPGGLLVQAGHDAAGCAIRPGG